MSSDYLDDHCECGSKSQPMNYRPTTRCRRSGSAASQDIDTAATESDGADLDDDSDLEAVDSNKANEARAKKLTSDGRDRLVVNVRPMLRAEWLHLSGCAWRSPSQVLD